MSLESLFAVSPEFRAASQRFGPFLREQVAPGAHQRDLDATMPDPSVFRRAAELGLVGLTLPTEVGGGGADWWTYGQTLEAVGYHGEDASFCMVYAYRETVARQILETAKRQGRRDLIERYIEPHVRGESFVGWALTETQDLYELASRSRRVAGGYVLSGVKEAVTAGMANDNILVYVGNEDGSDLRGFIVHRADPGVTLTAKPALGFRANGLARLELDEVFIPEDRVLVVADGLSHAQGFVADRRLTLNCWVPGRLYTLLERTIEALSGLTRAGDAVLNMKSTQAEIGKMVIGIETIRSCCAKALRQADAEATPHHLSLAMGKYVGAQQCIDVAHIAHRILGGMAYWREAGFDRFIRDFYGVLPIIGGPVVIEVDLGTRAVAHYTMAARQRRRAP